jgi:hypothetical protein
MAQAAPALQDSGEMDRSRIAGQKVDAEYLK